MAASITVRVPGSTAHKLAVLLVGDWGAMPAQEDTLTLEVAEFRRAPEDLRSFKRAVGQYDPSWLLVGLGPDDWHVRDIVRSARAVLPQLHLAMLGTLDDPGRYERWLRQSCHVYVQADIAPLRLAGLLRTSAENGLVLFEQAFQERSRARVAEPLTSLTRRETEVLEQVGRGLRNADVAKALFVTERTVEFHMTRLLFKLGARNRVEAVERATQLGLL